MESRGRSAEYQPIRKADNSSDAFRETWKLGSMLDQMNRALKVGINSSEARKVRAHFVMELFYEQKNKFLFLPTFFPPTIRRRGIAARNNLSKGRRRHSPQGH